MRRAGLTSRERGDAKRLTQNKKSPPAANGKHASSSQLKSPAVQKASRLSSRVVSSVRNRSAPPLRSRSLPKRSHSASLTSESPSAKRPKVDPCVLRGRAREKSVRASPIAPQDDSEKKKASAMKKLITTDGFWASSNPVSDPDSSQLPRRTASLKRPSRTGTPENSPASTGRRKSASMVIPAQNNSKGEKDLGAGVPISELRRLQTTDGFWSPSISATGLRSESRDGSPSSTSSLDRSSRHHSRLLQQKNVLAEGSVVPSTRSSSGTSNTKLKSGQDATKEKPLKTLKEKDTQPMLPDNFAAGEKDKRNQRSVGKPCRVLHRLGKKSLLQINSKRFAKSRHLRSRPLGTRRKEQNQDKSKSVSLRTLQDGQVMESSRRSMRNLHLPEALKQNEITLSRTRQAGQREVLAKGQRAGPEQGKNSQNKEAQEIDKGRDKQQQKKSELSKTSSLERKSKLSQPVHEKAGHASHQTRLKTVADGSSQTEQSEPDEDQEAMAPDKKTATSRVVLASPFHSSSSSKLAISDLLVSGELKRLDTTPGFWAPTPDVSHVLGCVYPKRALIPRERPSRDSAASVPHMVPKKMESSLLQLRKKKLNALQKQRQIKQQSSRGIEQTQKTTSHEAVVSQEKPKGRKSPCGQRKRKYLKRSASSAKLSPCEKTEDLVTVTEKDELNDKSDQQKTLVKSSDSNSLSDQLQAKSLFKADREIVEKGCNALKPDFTSKSHCEADKDMVEKECKVLKPDSTRRSHVEADKAMAEKECNVLKPDSTSKSHLEADKEMAEKECKVLKPDSTSKSHLEADKEMAEKECKVLRSDSTRKSHVEVDKEMAEKKCNVLKTDSTSKSHLEADKEMAEKECKVLRSDSTRKSQVEADKEMAEKKCKVLRPDSTRKSQVEADKEMAEKECNVLKPYSTSKSHLEADKEMAEKECNALKPDSTSKSHLEADKEMAEKKCKVLRSDSTRESQVEADKEKAEKKCNVLKTDFTSKSQVEADKEMAQKECNVLKTDFTSEPHCEADKNRVDNECKVLKTDFTNELPKAKSKDEIADEQTDLIKSARTFGNKERDFTNVKQIEEKEVDDKESTVIENTSSERNTSDLDSKSDRLNILTDYREDVNVDCQMEDSHKLIVKEDNNMNVSTETDCMTLDSNLKDSDTQLTHDSHLSSWKSESTLGTKEKIDSNEEDLSISSVPGIEDLPENSNPPPESLVGVSSEQNPLKGKNDEAPLISPSKTDKGIDKDKTENMPALVVDESDGAALDKTIDNTDNEYFLQDSNIVETSCPVPSNVDPNSEHSLSSGFMGSSAVSSVNIADKAEAQRGDDVEMNQEELSHLNGVSPSTVPSQGLTASETEPLPLGEKSSTQYEEPTTFSSNESKSSCITPPPPPPPERQTEPSLQNKVSKVNAASFTTHGKIVELASKQGPFRKVTKRRRNAWQRGVVQRAAKFYRKAVVKTSDTKSCTPKREADVEELPVEEKKLLPEDSIGFTDAQTLMNTVRAAKKSAKEKRVAMLRRLQTDANLASGILDESALQSRILREAAHKNKGGVTTKKDLNSDVHSVNKGRSQPAKGTVKRGPGRPKKHKKGLGKVRLASQPLRVQKAQKRWYKRPPSLFQIPQSKERAQFSPGYSNKSSWKDQDADFVSESVDESDLHLYLSGVSDEEPSPAKSAEIHVGDTTKMIHDMYGTSASKKVECKTDVSTGDEPPTREKVSKQLAFQPTKLFVTKIKGKKGRPPGMPMTKEEKMKVTSCLFPGSDNYANFKMPRTARKSTFTPSLYPSSSLPSSAKICSLRQKSTRSPLEMLEIKRKQEEAIYDMEEEKRLAKRINRLEKRLSYTSTDGLSGDECDYLDTEIKECSVVLNDFVKKLHLESIDMPSEKDDSVEEENRSESPDFVQDNGDEDWCADLEDFQDDEEWTADGEAEKRPFIPRLKLKRIPKRGKEKKTKSHKSKKKSKFICPERNAQSPLKLVIKTEVLGSDSPAKSSAVVDISKIQGKGFEASFVDFLQGKTSDDLISVGKSNPTSRIFSSDFRSKNSRHMDSSASGKTVKENESHLIMNLGYVGDLKSKVVASSSFSEKSSTSASNSGFPISKQQSVLNDEMGAMQSSYNNTNYEKSGPELCLRTSQDVVVHENGDRELVHRQDVHKIFNNNVEESSISPATVENMKKQADGVLSLATSAAADDSVRTEAYSTSVSIEKVADSNPAINNNNDTLSTKQVQQTISRNVSSPKNTTSLSPKCLATCSCPEGWKVKPIQLADKQPSGKKFTCRRCSFTSPSQLTMESHIYSHIPGVQFRCAYCESEFSSMAATASHVKNTHTINEACLYISRHVEEQNFYDLEVATSAECCKETEKAANMKKQADGVGSERIMGSPRGGTQVAGSVVVAGGDSLGQGGQSPPVVISVLVSSGTAAVAAGTNNHAGVMVLPGNVGSNSSTPSTGTRRRYVCTHCGFSTNVRADAEHHVLDLHPSSSIFACSLCKENTFYSEAEIRQHAATVHPSRLRPYQRLPDFYDAEKLNGTGANIEDIGNTGVGGSGVVFEMPNSVSQENRLQDDCGTVDHRQRAKDYLLLQEGLKEKRSAEADSTTAVDYPDCEAEQSQTTASCGNAGPQETEVDDGRDEDEQADGNGEKSASEVQLLAERADHLAISSSAVCSSGMEQIRDEAGEQGDKGSGVGARDCSGDEDASTSSGLKIVQVVSLSTDTDLGQFQGKEQELPDEEAREVRPDETTQKPVSPLQASSTSSSVTKLVSSVESSASNVLSGATVSSDSSSSLPTSSPAIVQPSIAATSATSTQPGGGLPLSYKCSACRVHTPYLLMMVKHLKAKHPHMGCFSCPYCKISAPSSTSQPESFVTQKQLRSHIRKHHPDKTGRNEIALSAKAKQFVEAMVLPAGPECIRVGNRLVLEEDIHTCTYCGVKMTSLASVYEHLNEAHMDLFEFVCPMCQSFKSKDLEEISRHSLSQHNSEVETDKVHVSVPKNLFSVLKCISKGGKYIEKQLDGSVQETSNVSKSSTSSQQDAVAENSERSSTSASRPELVETPVSAITLESDPSAPLDLTSCANQTISLAAGDDTHPTAIISSPTQRIIQSPSKVTSANSVDLPRPVQVSFSSSLFDTSSLTVPPQLVVSPAAGSSSTLVPAAAASSFLSPQRGKSSASSHSQLSSSPVKVPQTKPHAGDKHTKGSSANAFKSLPVLNVPTIKPRPSPSALLPVMAESVSNPVHSGTSEVSRESAVFCSSTGTLSSQVNPFQHQLSATSFDDLPENEPTPDAFQIFNLQPTPPLTSSPSSLGALHSPSSSRVALHSPSGVPSVFPPVSAPLNTGYIQGPIVGFPAGMVISQALLPQHSFPQQQNTQVDSAAPALSNTSNNGSGFGFMSHRQSQSSPLSSFAAPQRPMSTAAAAAAASTILLKEKQQRELSLLKQQYQQHRQNFEQSFRESQTTAGPYKQQQFKEKQKLLRLQHLHQFHQKRQQQQLAHRHQMFQQAVLSQQQQARLLAQHALARDQSHPPGPASQRAWLQQQQQQQTEPHRGQETSTPHARDDFANARAHHAQIESSEVPRPFSASTAPPSSVSSTPSSSPAILNPPRVTKGVHKRSSLLYQCPYCPTPIILRPLEVASHIHQKHPGKQVTFKKAAV